MPGHRSSLGAGIRVTRLGPHAVDVEMKLRRWNRNYVGTHFGGSLYSMTDPFFMLMPIENLGPEYIVWDKAATIRFKKPGRGKVRASFVCPAIRSRKSGAPQRRMARRNRRS
jgi:acyl-coenzyme A thioesterase PaaI-like protein